MVQAFDAPRPRQLHPTPGPSGPRTPPHDLSAEESLLGAMLLSGDAINIASAICGPEDFYKPRHGNLFRAMIRLSDQGEPVDVITVTDEMKRTLAADLVADPSELVELQSTTPSVATMPGDTQLTRILSVPRMLAAQRVKLIMPPFS